MVPALYPFYHNYIDPDGVAYLTISKRYAEGDFFRAVNGYWSPWSCWLTALLIRLAVPAVAASIVVNTVGALGYLVVSDSLFRCFDTATNYRKYILAALTLFLCFAVYWQSFDDLWECFFLLVSLRIWVSEDFEQKKHLWVVNGVVCGLACLAKSYSFPYVLLFSFVAPIVLGKRVQFKIFMAPAVSLTVVMVILTPWILLLHWKYGFWTTSTAGALNTSWYLIGHPHWKPGIHLLLQPAYSDSPFYWEDPWIANADTPHFWQSFSLIGLQIVRIILNSMKFLISLSQMSVLFLVGSIVALVKRKQISAFKKIAPAYQKLILACLLFPSGYLLVNFESRYIWYLLPIGLILLFRLYENPDLNNRISARYFALLVSLSIVVFPIYQMTRLNGAGDEEVKLAQALKLNHFSGTFTSNRYPGSMGRLAYFSGLHYYYNAQQPCKTSYQAAPTTGLAHFDSLAEDIHNQHIDYYFQFHSKADDLPDLDLSKVKIGGKKLICVYHEPGVDIYKTGNE